MESKPKVNTISLDDFQKKYPLSQLETSHPLFSKYTFSSELLELIDRKIILSQYNLEEIANTKNFFILYELIPTEHTALTLNDIVQLRIIKWIMTSCNCHCVIQIADEETFAYSKIKFSQIKKIALEKLSNVLSLLLGENPTAEQEGKIHVFFNREFRLQNNKYESLVSQYKMKVTYDTVKNLFKITDDDSVSKIDYPCYIGGASNGDLYTEYVPEITKDSTCLIIDQTNKMYRYMLCFDASEKMKFKSPSVMLYKVIPQLTGTIGEDCFTDVEHSLVSSDEDKALRKKIMKHSLSGSRGNGSLEDHKKLGGDIDVDISCQYLRFIDLDKKHLEENIEKFGKGELSCGEIKQVMYEQINAIFNEIRKNIKKEVDKYFIKLDKK